MRLYVGKGLSGEILRFDLHPENTVEASMPDLVTRLYGYQMEQVGFVLVNVTQEFEYRPSEKIGDHTNQDDLLMLINPGSIGSMKK